MRKTQYIVCVEYQNAETDFAVRGRRAMIDV